MVADCWTLQKFSLVDLKNPSLSRMCGTTTRQAKIKIKTNMQTQQWGAVNPQQAAYSLVYYYLLAGISVLVVVFLFST